MNEKYALNASFSAFEGGERTHHVIAPIKLSALSIPPYDNKCKKLLKVCG